MTIKGTFEPDWTAKIQTNSQTWRFPFRCVQFSSSHILLDKQWSLTQGTQDISCLYSSNMCWPFHWAGQSKTDTGANCRFRWFFFIFSPAVVCNNRCVHITKTYLYNVDPLKSQFYIVKLGFIGVYIIFLISAQKHRLWVLVRTASQRWF